MGGPGPDPLLVLTLVQAAGLVRDMERPPPVTLGLVALNVLAFLRRRLASSLPVPGLRRLLQGSYSLSPAHVWRRRRLAPLLLSSFLHASTPELVVNMSSLLHTGGTLEAFLGRRAFAELAAYAVVAPSALLVLLTRAMAASKRRSLGRHFRRTYSGFLGALFCLTTVLNLQELAPRQAHVVLFGWGVPSRHAAWLELAVLRVLYPQASLLPPATGLLAGLLYVYSPCCRLPSGQRVGILSPRAVVWAASAALRKARARAAGEQPPPPTGPRRLGGTAVASRLAW